MQLWYDWYNNQLKATIGTYDFDNEIAFDGLS